MRHQQARKPVKSRVRGWVATAPTLLVFGGCAVGPDFHKPQPPAVNAYTREPVKTTAATAARNGAAQRLNINAEITRDWWELFGSPELNALVEHSLTNNPTIDSARAALKQAAEATSAQRGFFYPTVQGSYSPSRQRNAVGTISPTLTSGQESFSLHTAQLNVAYTVDFLGANRRSVENLAALEESQLDLFRAAELTVSSSVVSAAIQEAALREQIDVAEKVIDINRHLTVVLRRQAELGAASGLDVATQEASLAQSQQALPPLTKQLEQTLDAISVLAGKFPAEGGHSKFDLTALKLPEALPLSLPSRLVRQRPDVLAAEAQVHAASAAIGVAVADRLPQFAISADLGGTATKFAEMFATGNVFWGVSGNIAQTVFDGGTLLHRERGAVAAFEAAEAQYRSVVLTAFQNVADTLYAIKTDAEALAAASAAEKAAQRTFDLTKNQLDAGFVNPLALLAAEQALQQTKALRIQAEAARLTDSAALFQSLGGGWWNVSDPAATSNLGVPSTVAMRAAKPTEPAGR